MTEDRRRRYLRALQWALVAALPVCLLATSIGRFMLNHLFARAPYLQDTGMKSWLAYRDGVLLEAPKIALNYVDYYYDVYFSPLTSLFSVVSYAVPIDRLEWYVIVQSLLYAPLAIPVYFVASRLEPATAMRRLPITVMAALAFAFCGPVIWMVGYPHIAPAIPGLICLTLGAVVTGRARWAWAGLVLAASVRQDGGFLVATALAPLLFLRIRGVEMTPSRRKLIIMIGVAIGCSVGGMLAMKLFFNPYPRLQEAYFGKPLYSHLNADVLIARARTFLELNKLIYYPFLATCLIAVLQRDARYLLGWAAMLPWFLLSILAVDPAKVIFFGYTIGPFVVPLFWVYLYGAHIAPAPRRLQAGATEALFALVCLSSTLGLYRAAPDATKAVALDMAVSRPRDRAAVHAFVTAIREQRGQLGELRVDSAIATLAMENLMPANVWHPSQTGLDTIAFHRQSPESLQIVPYLIANQLEHCGWIRGTEIAVCSRNELAGTLAGVGFDPIPLPLLELRMSIRLRKLIGFEQGGIVVRTPRRLTGWLGELSAGTWEWTMTVTTTPSVAADTELAHLAIRGAGLYTDATVTAQSKRLALRFESSGGWVEFALRASRAPIVVTDVKLRPVAAHSK